jgi:hypothetical protein
VQTARSTAGSLPLIAGVEPQPVVAQAARVQAALVQIGASLPYDDARRLAQLTAERPTAKTVAAIQGILDPYCLAMVEINPEARVKVRRGPATAILNQSGWKCYLVKVHNEAGITATLSAKSPNALPFLHRSTNAKRAKPANELTDGQVAARFLEVVMYRSRPMKRDLSGLALEYAIVQIFTNESGKREAKIGFEAGQGTADLAHRNAIDVLFECAPAVKMVLRVKDESGAPTTASFTIVDGIERVVEKPVKSPLNANYRHTMALKLPWDTSGRPVPFHRLRGVYPLPARRLAREGYPDFFFQAQVYRSDGEHVLLPPGVYDITVSRGPEDHTQKRRVEIPATGEKEIEVDFQLERWVHLKKLGWYSVDHHVHAAGCSHYESPDEGVLPKDMFRQALGEDLNVACVLTWGPCWYFQKQFFDGKSHELSQGPYIIRYDVEVSGFPSSHAGHICLLRLKEDDYPGTTKVEEWPSWTLPVMKWAQDQGGFTGYAHSGWGLQPKTPTNDFPNFVPAKFDGIGANEFIVTVAHDAVDFISAGDTPLHWELNIWYHTLSVGFRTRISGETDFPCIFDERVGMARSYAKVDGKLTFEKAIDSIEKGRSYVSDGKAHIIDFQIDGAKLGEKGSELQIAAPGEVEVTALVAAHLPVKQDQLGAYIAKRRQSQQPFWDIERARIGKRHAVAVELTVNGIAVDKREIVADGKWTTVSFKTKIERSSWVALRVLYACHTNPIFVLVDKKPVRASRRSAEWCREGVETCWKRKSPRIRKSEKDAAKAAYDEALTIYDRLIKECFDDR